MVKQAEKFTEFKPPIRGVIHVTGFPDSGKTTFATTVPGVMPSDVFFFDFDGKHSGIAKMLQDAGHPYGYYANMLSTCRGKKPLEIFNIVDGEITRLKEKHAHVPVVIFDNWAPTMEEALREKGISIIDQISSITPGQVKSMTMLTWPATKRYYSQWLQSIADWADMVFVLTHVKAYQIGMTKVPGVFESRGQEPLTQLPVFRLWLLSSQAHGGAPNGLVMKRYSKIDVGSNGMKAVNAFPPKLVPCDWNNILKYLGEPVGDRPLTENELPSPWESTLVGAEYLPDQKQAIQAAMDIQKNEPVAEEEVVYANLALTEFVKAKMVEGFTAPGVILGKALEDPRFAKEPLVIADILRLMQ